MNPLFLTLMIAATVVLLAEGMLWWIFRQKISPLAFPHELDTSYFRFFSVRRLRLAAALHTLFLTGCTIACISYLW